VKILFGAFIYFVMVMCAGFVFGAARELVFVPALGQERGELLEAPLMLAAILASAWAATVWNDVPGRASGRLMMGLFSLAFVLAAELALSPLLRGSIQAWVASFTPLTLGLALVLWAAHAVMPALMPLPKKEKDGGGRGHPGR
jgi:hypothetical protein